MEQIIKNLHKAGVLSPLVTDTPEMRDAKLAALDVVVKGDARIQQLREAALESKEAAVEAVKAFRKESGCSLYAAYHTIMPEQYK